MVRDFVLFATIAVFSSVPIQCAVFGGGGMSPFFVINNGHIYIIMWSCPGNMPKYYPGLKDILPNRICLSDLGNILAYYMDKTTLISLIY